MKASKPDRYEVKPTWGLAWGIFWRLYVLYLAFFIPFLVLKIALKFFDVFIFGVDWGETSLP